MRYATLISTLFWLLLAWPAQQASAQDWALEGYDPVGYVRQGQPVPGRNDIATMWKGRIWHFASEENRARFEADPRRYAPGLGGNCPVSLSEGRREAGDPQYFIVMNGRLYVMRSANALQQMQKNGSELLNVAQQRWRAMR